MPSRPSRRAAGTSHALTHAHPDHQVSSHAVCEALGIPLWCGAANADAVETPEQILARMPAHANLDPLTGLPALREPPRSFTPDPARNRESARKLAALEPALICFGHGPPSRDTERFIRFVAALAA